MSRGIRSAVDTAPGWACQPDAAGMLQMPPEACSAMLGVEHYREPARAPGMVEGWPFA